MNTQQQPIRDFTDLLAWKEAHALALLIYGHFKVLPHSEKYNLTSQIQRASVSVTSNIAEGFSRRSAKEKTSFLYIALGSLREIESQLLLSKDLRYISTGAYEQCQHQLNQSIRLLVGLIKSYEKRLKDK